ncbi:MAG: PAS domain S-box protein [Desulfobacteraceae bacterium]|nr:PAS domain S-box protein [Desulfobacteraceae bacterium]
MPEQESTRRHSKGHAKRGAEAETKNSVPDLNSSLRDRSVASFLDHLPGMVYRCRNDEDWTMEFVSSGSAELTGYQPFEIENNSVVSFGGLIHPDDQKLVWDSVQDGVTYNRPFRMEYRINSREGQEKWVWEQGRGVLDAGGELLFLEGFIADITDSKRTAEQLNRMRNLLESVVINLPTAVFLKDATDLRFLMWNRSNEELLGIKASEVLGRTDTDLFPEEQANFFAAMDRQTIERGELQDIPEETISTRSRGQRVLHTKKIPIFEGGRPLYLLGISEDITDRKMAEETLRESEEKYHKLFEGFPNAIFVETAEGNILDCNSSACEMFGYTRDEISGKNMRELLPDDAAVQWPENPEASPVYVEVEGRRKGGIPFSSEVGKRQVAIKGKQVALVHVRDLTERKQAEEERRRLEAQILQAQKLESLGILAGGIAHDFNNLLTAILGYADLASFELPPQSPCRENIEQIIQTGRRASELTKQMLAYSGRGKFSIQPLLLSHVVSEMEHLLEVSISKKCELLYDFARNIPAIEADAAQIRQVIMNLIINASEAIGEEAGIIKVSTGVMFCNRDKLSETYLNENLKEGRYVYLEVADNGCGMSFETRTRLFDPFYTTKFTGRGLGLAAVLGIVRGHNGAIQVHSEPGKGTSFRVFFPASGAEAQGQVTRARNVPKVESKGTVLVVDDEDIVRELAEKMLRRSGYNVVTARDGCECLDIVQAGENDIDLILLDMTMPKKSGEETFQDLKRLGIKIPVVLSSGYSAQDITSRFPRGSFVGFIQKPFVLQQLIEIVQKTLQNKQ